MKQAKNTSRRSFLGLGAAAAAGLSGALSPLVRAASRNRNVVCIYMIGGNDSNNMIVPLDSPAYDAYARNRGPLVLSRDALLPVRSDSANYGFHPSLPGLRDLYNQNVLAVVANVGRVAPDHQITQDGGDYTREMQLRFAPGARLAIPWAATSARTPVLGLPHGVTVVSPSAGLLRDRALASAAAAARPLGKLPSSRMGSQLGSVLSVLKNGTFDQSAFLVPQSGYQTSSSQLDQQAALFAELDDALPAFYRALRDLGMAESTVVYTDTEFNRTLTPNKFGGSDHAWGGHQLVLGSSALGGQIYGQFPSMQLGGADDAVGNGTWTPSISSAQYAATLAYWYGKMDFSDVPEYAASPDAMQNRLYFLLP
jgi:uncharacterized protein (DUF1501 family)